MPAYRRIMSRQSLCPAKCAEFSPAMKNVNAPPSAAVPVLLRAGMKTGRRLAQQPRVDVQLQVALQTSCSAQAEPGGSHCSPVCTMPSPHTDKQTPCECFHDAASFPQSRGRTFLPNRCRPSTAVESIETSHSMGRAGSGRSVVFERLADTRAR